MTESRADGARRIYREAGRSVLLGLSLFTVLGGAFLLFVYSAPGLRDEDKASLKQFPPRNLMQLKLQREVLLGYAKEHPAYVLSGLCMLYILMQTFAVPGTLSLSLLAGALYGVSKGLFLVSVVSTFGAVCCYFLSLNIGKGLAKAVWPEKVESFGKEVDKRRGDMFSYIVFLRVTPILPNTFINMASPVARVPLTPFLTGTFFGCMPNNFVAVNAGSKLSELKSYKELYSLKHLLLGICIGLIALLPVYLQHQTKLKKAKEEQSP